MYSKQHQHHQKQQYLNQYYIPTHYNIAISNGMRMLTQHQLTSSSYHDDPRACCFDLDESIIGNGNWILDDLRSLHRCVPALRRRGIDVSAIRMHFYPEGGWGWLVCAAGYLALLLTTGMQLAFGQLHIYVGKHLGQSHLQDIAWIGSLNTAVSYASSPLVLGICRRGSTRLTAVIGGLVLALAALFTSFAVKPHQILLSYGLVLGVGAGLVRETAGLVLSNYFRKRREFVEMIVQAGTGIGIALFSVLYKETVGKLGWRLGLQIITGVLFVAFFLGLVYRSAALYHPQRHAIVHLKNQQNKLKLKSKSAEKSVQQPLIDLTPLNCRPVRMLMLAAGTASFGLYTPAFCIALQKYQEENNQSTSVLLQTCLGLSVTLGCIAWGLITLRPSSQCLVSRQYLCQGALVGVAITQAIIGNIKNYHGLILASGLYGVSLGGILYSLKMLTLERIKSRQFAKSWALIQAAKAMSILLGVPFTGYINASNPRVGYYICSFSSLCGATLLFFVGWGRPRICSPAVTTSARANSLISTRCACSTAIITPGTCNLRRLPKSQSLHITLNKNEAQYSSLASQINYKYTDIAGNYQRSSLFSDRPQYFHEHLRPSKSVPEGLGHQSYNEFYKLNDSHQRDAIPQLETQTPKRCHNVTLIEQITTSV